MSITERYTWSALYEDLPVVYAGLEFYPLKVRDYDVFLRGKQAYELMQGSLKVPKLARLPWCACLSALDTEFSQQTGGNGFFLTSALTVMAYALRLDTYTDPRTGEEKVPIRCAYNRDRGELTAVQIGNPPQNGAILGMQQMDDIRRIIATQNGYEIPNENWNPELVKAAQENAKAASGIEYDLQTLLFSVAIHAGVRPKEILDWTILEFEGMQDAIDRDIMHRICTEAEIGGQVKFKSGNPYPSWKFNRRSALPTGFRSLGDIEAGTKGLIAGV